MRCNRSRKKVMQYKIGSCQIKYVLVSEMKYANLNIAYESEKIINKHKIKTMLVSIKEITHLIRMEEKERPSSQKYVGPNNFTK